MCSIGAACRAPSGAVHAAELRPGVLALRDGPTSASGPYHRCFLEMAQRPCRRTARTGPVDPLRLCSGLCSISRQHWIRAHRRDRIAFVAGSAFGHFAQDRPVSAIAPPSIRLSFAPQKLFRAKGPRGGRKDRLPATGSPRTPQVFRIRRPTLYGGSQEFGIRKAFSLLQA